MDLEPVPERQWRNFAARTFSKEISLTFHQLKGFESLNWSWIISERVFWIVFNRRTALYHSQRWRQNHSGGNRCIVTFVLHLLSGFQYIEPLGSCDLKHLATFLYYQLMPKSNAWGASHTFTVWDILRSPHRIRMTDWRLCSEFKNVATIAWVRILCRQFFGPQL